ncbi:MAG: VanZ family protein [Thermoanaerobaculia bacterium]
MSFIFFLSSQSSPPLFIDITNIDKLIHFIEYFILGLLLSLIQLPLKILISLGIIYGGLDEIHQSFVSGRDCSLFDFLFDSLGVSIALLGVWLWKRKKSL